MGFADNKKNVEYHKTHPLKLIVWEDKKRGTARKFLQRTSNNAVDNKSQGKVYKYYSAFVRV